MTGNPGWLTPRETPSISRAKGPGIRRALPLLAALLLSGALLLILSSTGRENAAPGGWSAAWAPDGRRIAFLSGPPTSVPNLWVMGADGRNQRRLTTRGARALWWSLDGSILIASWRTGRERWWRVDADTGLEQQAWEFLPPQAENVIPSPDGRRLAFAIRAGRFRDLWVMASDGTERRGVSRNLWVRSYVWAPDGRKLLFTVGRVVTLAIWQYDIETRILGQVYGGFAGSPAVSPDGARAAFTIPLGGGKHDIVILNLRTSTRQSLKVVEADGGLLAWSPDGRVIAFTARKPSGSAVMIVPASGGKPRRITPDWLQAGAASWSADGSRLLIEGRPRGYLARDLYSVDAGGRRLNRLTRSQAAEWNPVWSPDARRLAYFSDEGGARVWILEGDRRTSLGPELLQRASLSWIPGGNRLLLAGSDVRILSPDGKLTLLVPPGDDLAFASWDPRGSRIAYTKWEDGRPSVHILDLHRRRDLRLLTGASHPAWSPDGRLLAFIRAGELWTSRPDGKGARRVMGGKPGGNGLRAPVWSADGTKIVLEIVEEGEPPVYALWLVEVPTGRPTRLFRAANESEFTAFLRLLTTSPVITGEQVLFSWVDEAGQPAIWTAVAGRAPRLLRRQASSPDVAGGKVAYVSFADRQRVVIEELTAP